MSNTNRPLQEAVPAVRQKFPATPFENTPGRDAVAFRAVDLDQARRIARAFKVWTGGLLDLRLRRVVGAVYRIEVR